MKELDRSTLTLEQKFGLINIANLNMGRERNLEGALQLIREHRLGGVYVSQYGYKVEEFLARVRETADYPILIFVDAEQGHKDYKIPQAISLNAANSEELAYSFGRISATACRRMGCNTVCLPVIDMCNQNAPCGGVTRSLGSDKEKIAKIGAAIARGVRAGGMLSVAKHYPSVPNDFPYDSHMRENYSSMTEEELVDGPLYAYRKLMEENLIDGTMTAHTKLINIDPDRPASLSKPVLDIYRNMGFRGFYITDALNMMGVVLKYGVVDPIGLSIAAGNDIPLCWTDNRVEECEKIKDCFERGLFTMEDLDRAVSYVLDAQHKVAMLPPVPEILDEDVQNIKRLSEECISAVCDEGYTPAIDRNARHLFVMMVDQELGAVEDFTPGPRHWYIPSDVSEKINELFPNSELTFIPQFPGEAENHRVFDMQTKFDDVVFITSYTTAAFTGRECLTSRIVDLMDALQSADRIVAHMHYGNPFVAEDAPYVPRRIIGYASRECVKHGFEILAGNAPAVGTLPFDLHFHERGHIFY